jgi:hypothetical protein
VDLMFAGDGKIIGFDGIFAAAHGDSSTNWDDWDGLTPEQVSAAVEVVDWGHFAKEAQLHGDPPPPAPKPGGIYSSAAQLDSRQPGGPTVNLLTRDQSVNWFFKTREGALGILQLISFTNDPPSAKIRYKVIQHTDGEVTAISGAAGNTHETLAQRLEAASMMTDTDTRNNALSAIATAAGKAGEIKIIKESLSQIIDNDRRNQTAREVVRSLAKRGQKKQALEIAKNIDDMSIRDQALSELAK